MSHPGEYKNLAQKIRRDILRSIIMIDEAKLWYDLAEENWNDVQVLLNNHRYGLAVFTSQQMVEKILKAYIIHFKKEAPPKTHRIEDLIEISGLNLGEIHTPDVAELSKAYIRVRYPDLNKAHYRMVETVQPLLDTAQTVYLWIKSKFNNH